MELLAVDTETPKIDRWELYAVGLPVGGPRASAALWELRVMQSGMCLCGEGCVQVLLLNYLKIELTGFLCGHGLS